MEKINPVEVGKDLIGAALNVGKFVVDQLQGGAWADLPHPPAREAKPPVRANITYYPGVEKD